ncbi:hypothetical protein EOB36_20465 [Mesorhizobium sp. M6A.T.Cr.TU.017.01.1.1]|nr:hypothetical protein EOB36_20465 [Mesorhizobium sp. M6A.T.Cr.TU.017.01.1.1]
MYTSGTSVKTGATKTRRPRCRLMRRESKNADTPRRPPTNNAGTGYKGVDRDDPYKDEAKHFQICPACGQEMDMRDLGEALHHGTPGHKPLRYVSATPRFRSCRRSGR